MAGSDQASVGPGTGDDRIGVGAKNNPARRSRRAAEGPVDAVPEPRKERESQARARDREALRTYRALAEGQSVQDDDARTDTPTRRQRRLQQDAAGRAYAPAQEGAGLPPAAEPPAAGDSSTDPATPAREDGTGIRTGSTAAGSTREPVTGGRRDRRRQNTAQTAVVSEEPVPSDPSTEARRIEDMDIEEALAARQAIIEDGREQAAAIAAKGDDPFTVDLGVLARQKALAERAAVLTSRARRMQELADQNQQRRPAANDPTAAHNLSIVTPPEFVRMPGSAQTVLRAPTTSHVPVVLPRSARPPITGPSTEPSTEDPEAGAPVPGAAVQDGTPETDRIQARSAFGLEPLDAMTAGLGRLRRLRYIQYSLLGVGAAALVTGIIMTVSSLNG